MARRLAEAMRRTVTRWVLQQMNDGVCPEPVSMDVQAKIAPTGVMIMFAILYFGLMIDSGLFDPIVIGLLMDHGRLSTVWLALALLAMSFVNASWLAPTPRGRVRLLADHGAEVIKVEHQQADRRLCASREDNG